MNEQVILASASPRRRELLDQIGVRYIVHPVDINEAPIITEAPVDYVTRVAAEKSAASIFELNGSLPVLSADTCVVIGGHILGKPNSKAHAEAMLKLLSGKTHQVYSAVSFRTHEEGKTRHYQKLSVTEVTFRNLTEKDIQAYWRTGEPQGKAGSYAIQGLASIFVTSINGSFSGVMGLPLFETAQLLSKQGIHIIT